MAKRPKPTAADYLVIAISPALIMLLVGSLVFFLLTAFYQTEFAGRLKYISALFVFAAVLITRVSIMEGGERAAVLSVPLAAATWVTLAKFTVAGIFAIPLVIGITWWAAHKLTWNCTLIDEQQDDPGGGLAQAIGFDAFSVGDSGAQREPDPSKIDQENQVIRNSTKTNLISRFFDRERTRKAQTPGAWVLYFGFATLPLFGLGQLVIPAADIASRQAAFRYLVVYVAAALGLLGTTSFLSLRRYLRQRKLTMPTDMATVWPASTGVIIVLVIFLCSFLPRPRPAYSLTGWLDDSTIGRSLARKMKANRFSALKGNEVDSEEFEGDVPQETKDEKSTEKSGRRSTKDSANQQNREGEKSNGNSNSNERNEPSEPGENGKPEKSDPHANGRDQSEQQSSDSRDNSKPQRGEKQISEHPQRDRTNESENDDQGEDQKDGPKTTDGTKSLEPKATQPNDNLAKRALRKFTPSFDGVGKVLRLLYYLAFAVGIGYLIIRHGGAILNAIQQFIRDLMGIFGRTTDDDGTQDPSHEIEDKILRRPFSDYRDPFNGSSMDNAELVRYSFLALEAWALEKGVERQPDETPHEFSRRLGKRFPDLQSPSRYLIQAYELLAYRGGLPEIETTRIQQLWQHF